MKINKIDEEKLVIDSNYLAIGKYTIIITVLCIAIMVFTIVRRVLTKKYKGDHIASGMIIGISAGLLAGSLFERSGFGMIMGMSLGEILGMTIGVLIPKK